MAWFGSGISQITGQISNFTKEVLTEGTEEVDGRFVYFCYEEAAPDTYSRVW